jgi:hypothetical protein
LISNHFDDSVSGPEKAGVGGSIPSLATILFSNLTRLKKRVKLSRVYNTRTLAAQISVLAPLIRTTTQLLLV